MEYLHFFYQAARKEQRFKAIHKSNRAAEKIVKNYLKAKALETVTKRKRYFILKSLICMVNDEANYAVHLS